MPASAKARPVSLGRPGLAAPPMLLPGGLTVAKTVRVVLLHLVIMALPPPRSIKSRPACGWERMLMACAARGRRDPVVTPSQGQRRGDDHCGRGWQFVCDWRGQTRCVHPRWPLLSRNCPYLPEDKLRWRSFFGPFPVPLYRGRLSRLHIDQCGRRRNGYLPSLCAPVARSNFATP